ncbi:Peptidyl-prolyl cis-trans isomerase cyp3 [Yarrowia sp. B02]|nr:Peptidyl-prolyl cis-trans isomerase cyp3 [Yarrowia sp. B02]
MTITFLDVTYEGQRIGRIKFKLYADDLPKTCENFRQFCTGEYRIDNVPQGYKESTFHRVVKGFMIQGGDFVRGNGLGTVSVFGSATFPDEKTTSGKTYPHIEGALSMANSGKDTNGCQFFITTRKCPELDGSHVVFGHVIEGMDVVKFVENVPVVEEKPKRDVVVSECGEY